MSNQEAAAPAAPSADAGGGKPSVQPELKTVIGRPVYVQGTYALVNPQVGTNRKGDHFLKCILRDATGEVSGRKWTFRPDQLHEVSRTGFVRVSGHSQEYGGGTQVIIEAIEPREITADDLVRLLPSTDRDIEAMFARVAELVRSLEHPGMRSIGEACLADDRLMTRFRQAPAGVSMHHACIGGLLQHTLDLMELADRMLPVFAPGGLAAGGASELNRDLVLLGLFLHDLGKTDELSWDRGFEYTRQGNLVGHVVRGTQMLTIKAFQAARETGTPLPEPALDALAHVIVSHHGRPEHGAVKVPATPEAVFVAHLDNLQARTRMALDAADRASIPGEGLPPESSFSDRHFGLETRVYRPDPLRGA